MQEMERESTDHSKFIVHVKPDKIYKSLTALDKISRRRGEALARTTSFPLSLDITGFNRHITPVLSVTSRGLSWESRETLYACENQQVCLDMELMHMACKDTL